MPRKERYGRWNKENLHPPRVYNYLKLLENFLSKCPHVLQREIYFVCKTTEKNGIHIGKSIVPRLPQHLSKLWANASQDLSEYMDCLLLLTEGKNRRNIVKLAIYLLKICWLRLTLMDAKYWEWDKKYAVFAWDFTMDPRAKCCSWQYHGSDKETTDSVLISKDNFNMHIIGCVWSWMRNIKNSDQSKK